MLQEIANYLVDQGVDEAEVDHLVRQKYFGGKSILDYLREDNIYSDGIAWRAAVSWATGEDFESLCQDTDFDWQRYLSTW